MTKREIEGLMYELQNQGWMVRLGSKHYVVYPADKTKRCFTISGSSSDKNAERQMMRELLRSGYRPKGGAMKFYAFNMDDIPILSKDATDRLQVYLILTRPWLPLSKEDHQKWKLLSKATPILWPVGIHSTVTRDQEIASIAYASVCKTGISDYLISLMRLYAE